MPNRYAGFKLDSALQVKESVVQAVREVRTQAGDSLTALDWPEICARATFRLDSTTVAVEDLRHSIEGQAEDRTMVGKSGDSSASESVSSSSSSSSHSSSAPPSKKQCTTIFHWISLQGPSAMIHWLGNSTTSFASTSSTSSTSQSACKRTFAGGLQGATMESIDRGRLVCNNCWKLMPASLRQSWLSRLK